MALAARGQEERSETLPIDVIDRRYRSIKIDNVIYSYRSTLWIDRIDRYR